MGMLLLAPDSSFRLPRRLSCRSLRLRPSRRLWDAKSSIPVATQPWRRMCTLPRACSVPQFLLAHPPAFMRPSSFAMEAASKAAPLPPQAICDTEPSSRIPILSPSPSVLRKLRARIHLTKLFLELSALSSLCLYVLFVRVSGVSLCRGLGQSVGVEGSNPRDALLRNRPMTPDLFAGAQVHGQGRAERRQQRQHRHCTGHRCKFSHAQTLSLHRSRGQPPAAMYCQVLHLLLYFDACSGSELVVEGQSSGVVGKMPCLAFLLTLNPISVALRAVA